MSVFVICMINGYDVNFIGFGCMLLSWVYGILFLFEDGVKVLYWVFDIGYNYFDIVCIYGEGKNEMLIGNVLKDWCKEFFFVFKIGIFVEGKNCCIDCCFEMIWGVIEESL